MAQYPPSQDQQFQQQQPMAPQPHHEQQLQQQQQFGGAPPAAAPAHAAGQPGHENGLGPQLNAYVGEVTQFKVHPETPGAQPWREGFWNFVSPVETCAMAYCCPCIVFGRTHHRLTDPTLANYDHVNGACVAWLVSAYFGLSCILTGLERSKFRERFNLEGSPVKDFVCSACCAWCVLVQQEKEVIARSSETVPLNQGYQKTEGGMAYPPQ